VAEVQNILLAQQPCEADSEEQCIMVPLKPRDGNKDENENHSWFVNNTLFCSSRIYRNVPI